jgi:mRNA degradation ribonuclease J1/J2
MAGPELIAKGLTSDGSESFLLDEAKDVVRRLIVQYDKELREGAVQMDFQEEVRVNLRRFFNSNIGKKPVVLPMLIDL